MGQSGFRAARNERLGAGSAPSLWRFWRAPPPLRWLLPVYFGVFVALVVTAMTGVSAAASILWGVLGVAAAVYGLVLVSNVDECADYVTAATRKHWPSTPRWVNTARMRRVAGSFFIAGGIAMACVGFTGHPH